MRYGGFEASGVIDPVGLNELDQFGIRLAELHSDPVRIHMPDISGYRVILRPVGSMEQNMNIDMIAVPERQDTPIRVTLKQQPLLADISHLTSLGHGFFTDKHSVQMNGCAGVTYSLHVIKDSFWQASAQSAETAKVLTTIDRQFPVGRIYVIEAGNHNTEIYRSDQICPPVLASLPVTGNGANGEGDCLRS